ncbi:glycosyltransferase family 2 protein [Gelidibacter mesophilus]|uniref:glycosyltransferase family 2 protein n=1 Tax=Gelidibacter mesophilus TaxID=169050 RepID=UPI000413A2A3|nr:glycosyltransferase family A protein [Gelidibacter mesophilus]
MIVLFHKNDKCIRAFDLDSELDIIIDEYDMIKCFFDLASKFENRFVIWCHLDMEPFVLFKNISNLCSHKLVMASYNNQEENYLPQEIGYVDSSPFANPKKEVTYPTWMMSSCVGVIHSEVLRAFNAKMFKDESFDYLLNSIAKRGQSKGLFCYSAPQFLNGNAPQLNINKASVFEVFKFVKQHFKTRWTAILLFNFFIYENKLFVLPFLKSLLTSKKCLHLELAHIENSTQAKSNELNYDVIIPTIGRRSYLYDVLKDLANQTLIPKNVIIIEQNPIIGSVSDLDYLQNETWPFVVKHQFIQQTGACNSRNLALKDVVSEYVFMADDDIRCKPYVIENAFLTMVTYNFKAATLSCLQEGQKDTVKNTMQWFTFGSGCSMVNSAIAKKLEFDTAFEFGFGEDSDFGMQLRNHGCDIAYLPFSQLLHLKAPVGGFRNINKQAWTEDTLQPKPSPTVMLYNLKHQTLQQQKGYKTLLFIKFFNRQPIKNPFSYFKQMIARWNRSVFWAEQLMNKTQ